ncbi:MAG: hypothetical protein JXR96_27815 [Deltaproteobacteria bacterium]|nr:hypothetical protein [Deltaproteobacteria bacterium]
MRACLSVLVCALLLGGCGSGDGDLDKDVVTHLPDGNASGSAASGVYDMEIYTSACEGMCPEIDYGIFVYHLCDVGDRDSTQVLVDQADGHLQVDLDSDQYVTRLAGGIDSDGSFDIGGYGTQNSGSVQITARFQGVISGDEFDGQGRMLGKGTVDQQRIDCTASYEITGTRIQSP